MLTSARQLDQTHAGATGPSADERAGNGRALHLWSVPPSTFLV